MADPFYSTEAPAAPPAPVDISVVVPVYGCEDCLVALHERLTASLERVTSSYEVVFVDDRSPDGAWETLERLARRDRAVRAIRLSRNFGQHAAITAGLAESRGRWTVVMDCDLQEPPEAISRLWDEARGGYDVVHTRRARRRQPLMRRLTGRAYFRLRNVFSDSRTGIDHGTMSMLSRPVVDAFLTVGDRDREYLIMLDWLGFRQTTIDVEHAPRHAGASAYTPGRLLRVAVDGLFFQTTVLLRLIVVLGFVVAAAGVALAGYYLLAWFVSDPPSGYTSLSVLLLLLSGCILASLGVVGLYVGKVFEQVKGRPLFLVAERAPQDAPAPPAESLEVERAR
jgi:glycosyltransferase involved in cell wall biosynthesis